MAEASENEKEPTLLAQFRAFQRAQDPLAEARNRAQRDALERALAQAREQQTRDLAQAIRDHWAGRTPPAEAPILVRAYQAQREQRAWGCSGRRGPDRRRGGDRGAVCAFMGDP